MNKRQKGAFVDHAWERYPDKNPKELKAIVEEWGKSYRKPGPPRQGDQVSLAFLKSLRPR